MSGEDGASGIDEWDLSVVGDPGWISGGGIFIGTEPGGWERARNKEES